MSETKNKEIYIYSVIYIPADRVEAAAKAKGYTGASGESLWDYVNDFDFEQEEWFKTKREAELRATELLPIDVYGVVQILTLKSRQPKRGWKLVSAEDFME